jgi:hypothetical protein
MEIYLRRDGERTGPYSLEEVNRQLATGTLTPYDLGWSETSPGWKPLLSFAGVIVPGGASSTPVSIGIATPVRLGLPEYAGFWIRGFALMIDAIILGIFALVIGMWFKPAPEEGYGPSTAGQRICGLRVIDAIDGSRISFMRGVLRVLAMILSGLILGIGFLMAAFTERKRALHDILAGTCVVKRL